MWPKYTSRSLFLFSISLQHYVYNVFKGGIMCSKNTILSLVFGFLAPKPAYSQGVTSYTQTQQTRQVTVIKPAAPSPASSTFSIYPVTSTVQPVAAAASVVPTYSQSPTYSTNAVTYSGELNYFTCPSSLHFLFYFCIWFFHLLSTFHMFSRNILFGLWSSSLLGCLQLLSTAAAAAETGCGSCCSICSLDGKHFHQESPLSEQNASP